MLTRKTRLEKGLLLNNRYKIDSFIREGDGRHVYKVNDTNQNNQFRIVKFAASSNRKAVNTFERGYKVLNQIPAHPQIIKAIEFDKCTLIVEGNSVEIIYIILDYIEGCDLKQLIEKSTPSLEDSFEIANQIATVILHLHENGVYHRDIKTDNIIWSKPLAYLIDFGDASFKNETVLNNVGFPYFYTSRFRI